MFPAQRFQLLKRRKQVERISVVLDARIRRVVFQRVDFARAVRFAGDDPAGFVRRICARQRDELVKLSGRENHCEFLIFDF